VGEFGDAGVGGERGGLGVYVADCGVQGGVAFEAVDGVAFEAFLVEEDVDYFVCEEGVSVFLFLSFVTYPVVPSCSIK
jgi:hypothetical protein